MCSVLLKIIFEYTWVKASCIIYDWKTPTTQIGTDHIMYMIIRNESRSNKSDSSPEIRSDFTKSRFEYR